MRAKASLVRTLVKRGAHGGEGQRIAGQRSADAAGVAVFEVLAFGDALSATSSVNP